MNLKKLVGILLFSGSMITAPHTVFGEGEDSIVFDGVAIPLPPFNALVSLKNIGNASFRCTISIGGMVTGNRGGVSIQGHVFSSPTTLVLDPGIETSLTFVYANEVRKIRRAWGDPEAAITSVLPDNLNKDCQRVGGSGPDPDPGGSLIADNYYMVRTRTSGKCLNLEIQSLSDPAGHQDFNNFLIYDCPPRNNEWVNNYFWIENSGSGRHLLQNKYSDRCLAPQSRFSPSNAVQRSCGSAGRYRFQSLDAQYYMIKDAEQNLCLTVAGTANKSNVSFSRCSIGDLHQPRLAGS